MPTLAQNTLSVESHLEPLQAVPIWLWIILGATTLSFAVWIYWTERGPARQPTRFVLAGIRFLLIMFVVWMLGGWNKLTYKAERPGLAIVIDRSQSMSTTDVPVQGSSELLSRYQTAYRALGKLSKAKKSTILNHYETRWFTAAGQLEPLQTSEGWAEKLNEIRVNGPRSALGDSLTQLVEDYSGRGAAAIIFLSDGINTAGRSLAEAAKVARASGTPVYAVTIGRNTSLPDIRIADLLVERNVYFGDRVALEVSVIASDIKEAEVQLTLSNDETGKVYDRIPIRLGKGQDHPSASLSFVPSEAGKIPLKLQVSSLNGERDVANNVIRQTINVQNRALRVLLVHQEPSYEFRFLKHFLERSTEDQDGEGSSFQLISVLQESDPDYVRQDASAQRLVPNRTQELEEIDVFVLGPFDPSLVSRRSQRTIVDTVSNKGAGCVFLFDSATSLQRLDGWPLADLLPVAQESRSGSLKFNNEQGNDWRWEPTTLGKSAGSLQLADSPAESSTVWARLPSSANRPPTSSIKVGSQTLIDAVSGSARIPLLVSRYTGAGRVVFQGSQETYRWTSFEGSDTYHQRYWGQLLRWTSRGKLSQLGSDSTLVAEPTQIKMGQPIRLALQLGMNFKGSLPDSTTILLTSKEQDKQNVTLTPNANQNRAYSTTLQDLLPGKYTAALVRPTSTKPVETEFVVQAPPGEQNNLKANLEGMKSLAKQTRGKHFEVTDIDQLFSNLPRGKMTRLGSLPPTPIWNAWWVALVFVSLISCEWLLRRRVRML